MAKATRSDQINALTRLSGLRVCDICSEPEARFCLTCNVSYCESHIEDHYIVPALQKHALLEESEEPGQRLCRTHQRPLEELCRLCVEEHDTVTEEVKQTESQVKGRKEKPDQTKTAAKVLPPPGDIKFLSISQCSVTLSWGPPEGLEGPPMFKLRWECDGKQSSLKLKDVYQVEVTGLKPAEIKFNVATVGLNGEQSTWVSKSVVTEIPPPQNLWLMQHGKTKFTLGWSTTYEMQRDFPHNFLVSCCSAGTDPQITYLETHQISLELKPDIEYILSVSTVLNNGEVSHPVSKTIWTVLPVIEMLMVNEIRACSATLEWELPDASLQVPSYRISYHRKGAEKDQIEKRFVFSPWTLENLQPATEYNASVWAVFDQEESACVSTTFTTGK